jgi:hypothetical protein
MSPVTHLRFVIQVAKCAVCTIVTANSLRVENARMAITFIVSLRAD